MTPQDRFLTAISGGEPDELAMCIWNNKLPGGDIDNRILDLGVCIVVKSSVWNSDHSGIPVSNLDEEVPGNRTIRTITYHTTRGDLREIQVREPGTTWIREFPFKSPDDYGALAEIISSTRYTADYNRFLEDDSRYGEQSVARPVTIHSPVHDLIYRYMGIEAFSYELAMNPGQLFELEKVLAEDWHRRMEVLASSPAHYAVIEGNTDYRVVSPELFGSHYDPYIREACNILHRKGILAGAHLDSDNRRIARLYADTEIDFVESFTPPPDCDMTISEGRRAWPGKAIQVHFPSSVHLEGEKGLRDHCSRILEDAGGKKGICIGLSEDVPDRGARTLVPMFSFLKEFSLKGILAVILLILSPVVPVKRCVPFAGVAETLERLVFRTGPWRGDVRTTELKP